MKYNTMMALAVCGALAFAVTGCKYDDVAEGGDMMLKVTTNENLGMTTLVHGHLGEGNHVTAKFRDWTSYKNGDLVPVHFTKMHFFDPETTNAIRKEGK